MNNEKEEPMQRENELANIKKRRPLAETRLAWGRPEKNCETVGKGVATEVVAEQMQKTGRGRRSSKSNNVKKISPEGLKSPIYRRLKP